MKTILLFSLVFVAGILPITSAADTPPGKIKIAVKEFPPLVFKDLKGFCIDIATIISEKNNMHPEFVMVDSVPSLLGAVESGACDMGFAGITITPGREKRVDFSQPFFESGLMIAVRNQAFSQISFIGNAFLRVIGLSIALFFVGLTVVAHLVWWIERDDRDPQGFPTAYGKGIVDAYWWAVVTMSTVGYGDKRPKKNGGRAIAAIWMFIGIIWFAGLTATLSSALTVDRIRHGEINDLPDLYGKNVAVIVDTTSEDFLRYHNVKKVLATSFDGLLASRTVEATIRQILRQSPKNRLCFKGVPVIGRSLLQFDDDGSKPFRNCPIEQAGIQMAVAQPLRHSSGRGALPRPERRVRQMSAPPTALPDEGTARWQLANPAQRAFLGASIGSRRYRGRLASTSGVLKSPM